MISHEFQELCKSRRDLLCHRGVNQRELGRTPAMFEQGTPDPTGQQQHDRAVDEPFFQRGGVATTDRGGFERHLRIDPKRSDLVQCDVHLGSFASFLSCPRMSASRATSGIAVRN